MHLLPECQPQEYEGKGHVTDIRLDITRGILPQSRHFDAMQAARRKRKRKQKQEKTREKKLRQQKSVFLVPELPPRGDNVQRPINAVHIPSEASYRLRCRRA